MKVLILGGSGQIGFPLACRFAERFPASSITATYRSARPTQTLPPHLANLQWIVFDPFADDWTALGTFDLVYNCIGQIRASREMSFARIHEGLTERLLQYRASLGRPRIVQLSALGAGDYPEIPFLATKARADERLLRENDSFVLRPSIVCSADTMLLRKLRQLGRVSRWLGGRLLLPEGFIDAKVQPIMIGDLVELLIRTGVEGGKERVLAAVGPEALRFGDLLRWVNGREIRVWEIPRKWLEPLIRYVVGPLLPGLINYDQFRLLFEDNVGDEALTKAKLGGTLSGTVSFWQTA